MNGTLGGNQDFNTGQVTQMVNQLPVNLQTEIEGFYTANPSERFQSSQKKQDFFENMAMLNPAYKDLILQQLGA